MCADVLSQTPAQENTSIIHEGMEGPARAERHVRIQTDASNGGRYGTSAVLIGLGGQAKLPWRQQNQ